MSALSTPGGGGNTALNKPASGKQKYQKLDINSLYFAHKNENSEPSSIKSQLSRKHGMQSLGKVPSARRPPANLPSLKTETGQDTSAVSTSAVTTTVSTQPTCTSQTTATTSNCNVVAGTGPGGWVPLPPPSSPHFRTEFPSLEASAQPSHRSSDHNTPQPQLRPQTEGSWTSGGSVGVRQEPVAVSAAAPAVAAPATQQTPALRAILPSFLMKGSSSGGLGLSALGSLRENRSSGSGPASSGGGGQSQPRPSHRPPATPRAVEVLTARPILRDDQISSLDDISRDAGWAQHDDIDYDQKLDFSDGESSTPMKGSSKNTHRAVVDTDGLDSKIHEPGDEEQLWAERRQRQNNEVAQAVARARQRKEEEQRRQMRETPPQSQPPKDFRDRVERDNNENRERETDSKERIESRDRDRVDRDRLENREKERNDLREKERSMENRDRERINNRDRFENRDRDRDHRDHDRERDRVESRDKSRVENRDRGESDKEKVDVRDKDRGENRDRIDRDRFERERDRERDRGDRDRNERDRDRDFRDRDREYGREREQNNPAFSKNFQANIPPRFLKQQQNRQEDQHKSWAFSGKPAPRRQEPPAYNAPRHTPHNGRRSYSRDYSDREDDFRRDGSGPQWRSEMQDYERPRELDRSNSKDSYKEGGDHKERKNDQDKKMNDNSVEYSSRSAAEKLSEVFERKSVGLTELPTDASVSSVPVRKISPPSVNSQRESSEKEISKTSQTSWADITQEESSVSSTIKPQVDKFTSLNDTQGHATDNLDSKNTDTNCISHPTVSAPTVTPITQTTLSNVSPSLGSQIQPNMCDNHNSAIQNISHNQQVSPSSNILSTNPPQTLLSQSCSDQFISKTVSILPKVHNQIENRPTSQSPKLSSEQKPLQSVIKPVFAVVKPEKELTMTESVKSVPVTETSSVIKVNESHPMESLHGSMDTQKRSVDIKGNEKLSNEHSNKILNKEPIERKSSGSGSEKRSRGYGGGGGGGYAVYNRGWGSRESRGRRSHRSSRSNNRASESDASTDGAPNSDRRERRRAPRSPRGPRKHDKSDVNNQPYIQNQAAIVTDGLENREPFAPRGQPSRRGRGGFQGSSRPPAPAKRVAGYGPPNTKSPFSQANRAVKENEEINVQNEDKGKGNNKPRTGSSTGRGRDRRPKGVSGPLSGEDENWETTSEHSESGCHAGRRRSGTGGHSGQNQKNQGVRNQHFNNRQNNGRNTQVIRKDNNVDKANEVVEAMSDLKVNNVKKDEDIVDDGFQEVRNKKNSKDTRTPIKEENQNTSKQPRSHSNQGAGRNGSSSRNSNDKSNSRTNIQVTSKPGTQYERPRQANLAPRFVKQRQKQQMGLVTSFSSDTGAAPPPPAVNAWDKPISQTLRGNVEEPAELIENKSTPSSQRSTPAEVPTENKLPLPPGPLVTDKSGVLDGTTPPVETIIFENTNYKAASPEEALQQKYPISANMNKAQPEDNIPTEIEARPMTFNGDVRARPRSIQELMGDNVRSTNDGDPSLGLQMSFDGSQKPEDSSDMTLDFTFDSDLVHIEDKAATLGLPRGVHMSTSNTISPLAADLNLKIASVKKVWEMPAVAEGSEELQFSGFEETNTESAPPNVCKVKPTQQLQSPPPQHFNHVGYQGGYGGLSVPSPPAVYSSQQLLGSSQQLPQQGGLYGAFQLDQTRGQFAGFPGTPYGASSGAPYNYHQTQPDMFQNLPNQYRMAAAAGGGAAFGQTGQLGNSPSTVLIPSTSNSLISATVKPSTQQIGAIGSKGVGGVGGVNTYQQQYLGYSTPVGEAPYSLQGILPRPAPPASSYYSPYQPQGAPAPTYPLQFTQPAQSGAFGSQFLSSQIHVAAAVQQMQQQYRAPLQQQYPPPQPRPPPQQQLKSPLHEHANGFAPLCESASPTPKGAPKPQKPPHSPPQHKYHAPPPHPPPAHTPHQHHQQQQMVSGGNNGRCGGGGGGSMMSRGGPGAPRYPAPIQRPHAPALPLYRTPAGPQQRPHHVQPRHLYYHHHQRNGGGERATEPGDPGAVSDETVDSAQAQDAPTAPPAELKAD